MAELGGAAYITELFTFVPTATGWKYLPTSCARSGSPGRQ